MTGLATTSLLMVRKLGQLRVAEPARRRRWSRGRLPELQGQGDPLAVAGGGAL